MEFVKLWFVMVCGLAAGTGSGIIGPGFVRESAGQNATSSDQQSEAKTPMAFKLPSSLDRFVKIVKPRADETRWRRIPWLTDLAQAQQLAKKENRSLFIFASGDDPLEAC